MTGPSYFSFRRYGKKSDDYEDIVKTEAEAHVKEVRDLPDSITCKKDDSTIIERIARSREQRHELALDEMQQEMLIIASVSRVCRAPLIPLS